MDCLKLNRLSISIKIFVFVLLLLPFNSIVAQMRQVYIDSFAPDNAIRRLSFISPSEGYVSFRDWIGYTNDSGHTFTKKYIGSNVNLNGYSVNTFYGFAIGGVKTINLNTIIAYGSYGLVPTILRSTDGGNTFTVVYYSQFNTQELRTGILDMIFPENNGIGYAIDADRILKTTNGGINWNPVMVDPASYFDRLEAVDNNIVVAMSTGYSTNKALKTINGGGSWQNMNLPVLTNGKFSYIYFLSGATAWVNMEDNNHRYYIFKTINGGNSWTLQNNVTIAPFSATKMKFINDSVGYALSSGIYKTINGGAVWEQLPFEPQNSFRYADNDFQVLSPTRLWAGGDHGFLEMSSNGGGVPFPKSLFLIDSAGVSATGKVNLVNYSRSDYTYNWYKNNVLISGDYNTSYTHNSNEYTDTIKLIVFNGITSDTSIRYQYYPRPVVPIPSIISITPTYGQKGSVITITGNNFIGVSSVSFGGTPAVSFNVISPTSIAAVLDSGRSGEVKVITAYGTATQLGFISQTPILDSFTPKSGGPGTIISITGENLILADPYTLKFGGTPAASFVFGSQTIINATVGNGSSGDITFQTRYGTATISGFTYIPPLPPPAISSFSPMQADESDTVTITGTSFIGTTAVRFGSTEATSFSVISPTTIKAIVGAGSSGKVFVTTPTGADSLGGFKYLTPIINSFTPAVGGSGTIVQINGENFTEVSSVSFGGAPATSFTVNSETSITAIVSNGASGNIAVVSPHGSVLKAGFIFSTVPAINSFLPASGPVGTVVKINGSNFSNVASNNIVWFGAVKAVVSSATSTVLTVIVPVGATYQPITVTTNGLTSISSGAFLVTFPGGDLTSDTYSSKINLNTTFTPRDILVSDLDEDGKPDLIIKSVDTISYYKNISASGTISFGIRKDFFVPGVSGNIRVSDLDGDGKRDIILIKSNHVSMFRNTSTPGNISFAPLMDLGIVYGGIDLAVGDMNGDGKQDIVMISNNYTSVSLNTSVGVNLSFASPVNLISSYFHMPNSVTIVDFDGDGKPDIAVSNTYSTGYSAQQNTAVSIYRNTFSNDTLSFATEINYGAPGTYNDISSADLDGDGRSEIIFGNGGYYNKPNNTFTPDFKISVLKNNSFPGTISFAAQSFQTNGNYVEGIAFGTMDGDNKPDIAVANLSTHMGVIRNTGSPGSVSFDPPITYDTENGTGQSNLVLRISVADLDGDSKPEIIICNSTYNTLSIFKNQGNAISKTVCANGSIAIASNITGTGYQWQADMGTGFVNITDNINYSGTATQTLQLNNVPLAWNNYQYRCVIGGSYSRVFILAVNPSVSAVMIAVADTIVCLGTPVTFTASPVNGGASPVVYQWQVNGVNVGTNSSTFTSSSLTNNSTVKLIMTSSNLCSVPLTANSNMITMSVKDTLTPTISISTSATKICSGTSVTFISVSVNGGTTPSYQWQVNETNAGDNNNTFVSDFLNNNDRVQVIMKSNASCLTDTVSKSNVIAMNVEVPVTPLVTLSNGQFVITNPDADAIYTWQVLSNSIWTNIEPLATGTTYKAVSTGNYRVASVKGECTGYSSSQLINVTERRPSDNSFGIYLYPNPAEGFITLDSIKLSENWETVNITNTAGVNVLPTVGIKNKTSVTIDVSNLRSGTYFATLRRKNGKATSLRFIKP